ncbi:MAG: hypothetical protein P8127_15625 [Acidobacteriota bacterium]
MKTTNPWVLGSLLAALMSVAANPPVAMRVELEPLRSIDGKTDVEVMIQVSPEDRGRLGDNVIVRIELDGGAVNSGSPMRAVRLETDGSVRFSVVWPPGEYDLRVGIEPNHRLGSKPNRRSCPKPLAHLRRQLPRSWQTWSLATRSRRHPDQPRPTNLRSLSIRRAPCPVWLSNRRPHPTRRTRWKSRRLHRKWTRVSTVSPRSVNHHQMMGIR